MVTPNIMLLYPSMVPLLAHHHDPRSLLGLTTLVYRYLLYPEFLTVTALVGVH